MDEIKSRRVTNLWRAVFVVMALLFFLPLMTIQGCGKDDVAHTYTGLQLVINQHAQGTAFCLLAPLIMLVAASIVRGRSVLFDGWMRACRCTLAVLGGGFFMVTTFILGMFSKLSLEPAGIVLISSFVAVGAISLLGASINLRDTWGLVSPENPRLQVLYRRWLPVLWVGVVPLGGLIVNGFDKEGFQFAGFMLILSIPLAMSEWFIGVGLSRREPWVVRAIALEAVMETVVTLSVALTAAAAVRGLKQYLGALVPLVILLVIPFLGLAVWVWWKRRELVDIGSA